MRFHGFLKVSWLTCPIWFCGLLVPEPGNSQNHPVSVTPGTPSIWSMEQAHYLLNRLRSSNDGLRTKTPGENDLDPNAVNGLRLDAIQSFFGVSGALDTSVGTLNKLALGNFGDSAARHAAFQQKADQLQTALFQENMKLAELKGQEARQKAEVGPTGTTGQVDPVLQGEIIASQNRITALTAQNQALSTAAGQAPAAPALSTVNPDAATPLTNSVLKDTVSKLLGKTSDQFSGPRLAASTLLDNFVQMQYEIVAKQLTALRDEAGEGQRIIFLEVPTSVSASARRVFLTGGEDKLAQSWWRINGIIRRYDKERSVCWAGGQYTNILDSLIQGSRLNAVTERFTLSQQLLQVRGALDKANNDVLATSSRTLDRELAPVDVWRLLDRLKMSKRKTLELEHRLRDAETTEEAGHIRAEIKDTAQTEDGIIDQLLKAETSVIVSIKPRFEGPRSYEDPMTIALLDRLESPCKEKRSDYEQTRRHMDDRINSLKNELKAEGARSKPDDKEMARLKRLIADKEEEMILESKLLPYDLEPFQLEIYKIFGGPEGLRRAFVSRVSHPNSSRGDDNPQSNPTDTHLVRAIEIIPRQTALNVNQTHNTTRDWAFMAVLRTITGFGAKANLQMRHEMYDQFMQQEVFASGFGKGETTFGWTFGPTPGTRVLNPGTRNTYAVLAVPDDATALQMEAIGCGFHKNKYPPGSYPNDQDSREKFWCENHASMTVAVPDRETAGGFWVDSVQYSQVKAGERASVVLQGSYLSPQITVLVNGKRLTQVLGLGKPFQAMDFGQSEAAEDGAISGSYEFVNEHYLALSLNVPTGFKQSKFPQITLISPSRTAVLNSLPLVINHVPGKTLANEYLLPQAKASMKLSDFQILGPPGANVEANVIGDLLSKVAEIRINGIPIDHKEVLGDSIMAITIPNPPDTPVWNIVARTKEPDPADRTTSVLQIPNPLALAVTHAEPSAEGSEFQNGIAVRVPVQLTGTGFAPRLDVSIPVAEGRVAESYYQAPDQWLVVVEDPATSFTLSLRDPTGVLHAAATPRITRPKPAPPAEKPRTTRIEIEKSVTEKH